MQEIVSSFKDRLMEKYQVLSDEYTEQFRRIDNKYMNIHESIALLTKEQDLLKSCHSDLQVEATKDAKALEDTNDDVAALKRCYTFEDRIAALEGKAKSDLLAVQMKMQEVLDEDKYNLKRAEAMKLMYAVQVDAAHKVMSIDKHKAKIAGSLKKPDREYDPYTTATLNLLEWQMAFNETDPFDKENSSIVASDLVKDIPTDVKKMRTEHLIVQLNARALNKKKLERSSSLPQSLLKIEEIPKVEMPEPKKKVVVFAREDKIFGAKPRDTGQSGSSPASPKEPDSATGDKAETLKKVPNKSNLRKFNKLLEPYKKRNVTLLSQIKRSNSFVWTPVEKPTIENLWEDPTRPSMMQRFAGKARSPPAIASPTAAADKGPGPVKAALMKIGHALTSPKGGRRESKLNTGAKRDSTKDATPLKRGDTIKTPAAEAEKPTVMIDTTDAKGEAPAEAGSKPSSRSRVERQASRKPSKQESVKTVVFQDGLPEEKEPKEKKPRKQKTKRDRKKSKTVPIQDDAAAAERAAMQAQIDAFGSTQSKLLETVEEEMKEMQSRQSLQAQVLEKIGEKLVERTTPALQAPKESSDSSRSNSVSPIRRMDTTLRERQRKSVTQTSESSAMFSSASESEVEIHDQYYKEFVSREDF